MTVRTDVWIDFNVSPRVVWVRDPAVSISIQELIDTIRELEAENNSVSYNTIASAAGKTFLYNDGVSDFYTGIALTLLDAKVGFEARGGPTYVQCQVVGGDLIAEDSAGDPMSPISPTAFTQVVIAQSTAPTLVITGGGGATPTDIATAVWANATGADLVSKTTLVSKILRNKTYTDPATGIMTVYDDDNTTVLFTANIKEDIAGTQPYRGQGIDRRDRLV